MKLYHGSLDHTQFEKNVYFSTSLDFSSDYGDVLEYEVSMQNTFDTLNEEYIKQLFKYEDSLYDSYDDVYFNSYEEYIENPLYGSDNWETFEQYINSIKSLGFDSMRIFEGGIENFVVFNHSFEVLN